MIVKFVLLAQDIACLSKNITLLGENIATAEYKDAQVCSGLIAANYK